MSMKNTLKEHKWAFIGGGILLLVVIIIIIVAATGGFRGKSGGGGPESDYKCDPATGNCVSGGGNQILQDCKANCKKSTPSGSGSCNITIPSGCASGKCGHSLNDGDLCTMSCATGYTGTAGDLTCKGGDLSGACGCKKSTPPSNKFRCNGLTHADGKYTPNCTNDSTGKFDSLADCKSYCGDPKNAYIWECNHSGHSNDGSTYSIYDYEMLSDAQKKQLGYRFSDPKYCETKGNCDCTAGCEGTCRKLTGSPQNFIWDETGVPYTCPDQKNPAAWAKYAKNLPCKNKLGYSTVSGQGNELSCKLDQNNMASCACACDVHPWTCKGCSGKSEKKCMSLGIGSGNNCFWDEDNSKCSDKCEQCWFNNVNGIGDCSFKTCGGPPVDSRAPSGKNSTGSNTSCWHV